MIAGKYRLEHQLGSGGMGSVWLATHLELGSKAAIKCQLDHRADSPEAIARFRREARAAAQLHSTHIVHIYDYGLDAGVPYIAMEFLAGESLRARLERDDRLAPSVVARMVLEVAVALEVAHQAGVIHRDLKPSNLFIAREGRDEIVKLLDFGIAKWTDPHQEDEGEAATSAIVGSAGYMSPEQARGLPLDYRTDLWSLAAVTYEMLTGHAPFAAPTVPAAIRKLELGAFEPPSSVFGIPTPELDQVFARALSRHPQDRFESAREFAQAVVEATTRFGDRGGEQLPPGQPRVLGRADNTASMGSAVVPRRLDQNKAPRKRAWFVGAGAAAVVTSIAWMWNGNQPPSASVMTQTAAPFASTVGNSDAAPPASSLVWPGIASTRATPREAASAPRLAHRALPKPTDSIVRVPARTAPSAPPVRGATDPVFGLEIPTGL